MNEKTNIGQSATGSPGNQTSTYCCGGGGGGGQGIAGGYFWSDGGTGCAAGKFGDSDFREQQLRKEKAEIYAALQQSELEANKWRCETEELRKAFASLREESAVIEHQLKYEKMRADCNFERAVEAQKKLAEAEEACRIYRNRELNNSGVAPGSLAKLEQKSACLNRIKDLISGVYGKI